MNTCLHCRTPFSAQRRHARFCSGACRMAACRTRQRSVTVSPVPAESRARSLLRSLLSDTRAFGLDGQRIIQWCLGCQNNHYPVRSLLTLSLLSLFLPSRPCFLSDSGERKLRRCKAETSPFNPHRLVLRCCKRTADHSSLLVYPHCNPALRRAASQRSVTAGSV